MCADNDSSTRDICFIVERRDKLVSLCIAASIIAFEISLYEPEVLRPVQHPVKASENESTFVTLSRLGYKMDSQMLSRTIKAHS